MSSKKLSLFDRSLVLLAKSSFVVLIGIILSKIFTYGYRIVIARYYGPEYYGLFSLSLMVIGWFIVFTKFGLTQGLLRYISLFRGKNQKGNISYIFRTVLRILIITSVIGAAILFFLSEVISQRIFSNPQLILFLKFFSFAIPITIILGTFLSIIRSYEKIGWFSFISRIFENGSKLAVLVLLILIGFNSLSIPISYLAGGFASLLVGYLVLKRHIPEVFVKKKISEEKKRSILKNLISYSWPLIFFGIIVSLFHWTDTLIIGIFRTVEEVGFYNAAIPISILLTLSKDLFTQLFFPLVTKEYSRGRIDLVRQLSKQVGKWVFILSMPIFLLIMIFPNAFINILFGPQYLPAVNALRFLTVGALFTSVFEISRDLISMKGKSKLILIDIIVVSVINLILNLILVPRYGISGAGFATMISLIILNMTFVFQSWKHLSILPMRKKILWVLVVSLIPALILLGLKQLLPINVYSLIFLIFVFFATYTILIIKGNCLDRNDKFILRLIKKKLFSG